MHNCKTRIDLSSSPDYSCKRFFYCAQAAALQSCKRCNFIVAATNWPKVQTIACTPLQGYQLRTTGKYSRLSHGSLATNY